MTSESTLQAYASQVIFDKSSNEFPDTLPVVARPNPPAPFATFSQHHAIADVLQVRLYRGDEKEYE